MSKKSRLKIGIMIYVEQDLLDEIDAVVTTNRSAWFVEIAKRELERLDRERDRMRTKESTE